MFSPGDIVKIQPNWLDKGEDPNTEYIVREDWGNGKVEVYLPKPNDILAFKGIWTWADTTMYKVGHVNIMKDGIEYYNIDDVLANDIGTVIVTDYDANKRLYTLTWAGKNQSSFTTTRFDLNSQGFRRV